MRKNTIKQMEPLMHSKTIRQMEPVKKITAILLSCSLAMAGCAGSPAQTPVNGQTSTASTESAGRETDTETADKPGMEKTEESIAESGRETAAESASSTSVTLPPAGREGLRDFSEEEESAESSAASEDSRSLAPVNQTQKC